MAGSFISNLFGKYHFHHKNISIDSMGTNIQWAVIASEDQLFAEHHGFDWNSIKSAMNHNEKKKNKIRGGSTISQQTAKNVFLWNGRNWFRKGMETYCTFWMETFWSKKRILETYLNVAEMGPNVYGVEAAAQFHFHKQSKKLTQQEACFLAALLPSPIKRSTTNKSFALKKAQWISEQIAALKSDDSLQKLINDK
jgi:monofunctional biosynthetic peptidoglycan transglycosylase